MLTVMRLILIRMRPSTGQVVYSGIDLMRLSQSEMRKVRANQIAMIFQDALTALNPVYTVGFQLAEQFRMHKGMSRGGRKSGRSSCSTWSGSRPRRVESTTIRTSSPAACASA